MGKKKRNNIHGFHELTLAARSKGEEKQNFDKLLWHFQHVTFSTCHRISLPQSLFFFLSPIHALSLLFSLSLSLSRTFSLVLSSLFQNLSLSSLYLFSFHSIKSVYLSLNLIHTHSIYFYLSLSLSIFLNLLLSLCLSVL